MDHLTCPGLFPRLAVAALCQPGRNVVWGMWDQEGRYGEGYKGPTARLGVPDPEFQSCIWLLVSAIFATATKITFAWLGKQYTFIVGNLEKWT